MVVRRGANDFGREIGVLRSGLWRGRHPSRDNTGRGALRPVRMLPSDLASLHDGYPAQMA